MKMSIFSMLFVLVLLAIAPIIYFNGGFSSFGFGAPKSLPKTIGSHDGDDVSIKSVTTDKDVTVYKWKDENGVWQYGNLPPNGVSNVESMNLRQDTNVMKAIPLEKEEVAERKGGSVVSLDRLSNDALNNPYAPESVKELMDKTMNLQNMTDQRYKQQQEMMNNLGR